MTRPLRSFTSLLVMLICMLPLHDAEAQNLVRNGDFEAYNTCPANVSTIQLDPTFTNFPVVQYWVRPTIGSSDYFHTCATTPTVSVPTNIFGYQQPHSGKAYAGLYGFLKPTGQPPYQEFISAKLPAPLKKDSSYCVSFFVSPTYFAFGPQQTAIAANSFAAFISDTLPTTIPTPSMAPARFIMNDTNIHLVDTSKWYEIKGGYYAKGGEQWITIGVFYDGPVPPYSFLSTPGMDQLSSYAHIDDVSITPAAPYYTAQTVQYCGDPLRISATSASGPYKWSTGETTRSIMVTAPGTYTCTAPTNCVVIIESVEVLPLPVSDTVVEQQIDVCNASGINFKLVSPIQGTRYTWSSGETGREITARATGTYRCDVLKNCRIYRAIFRIQNRMPEAPVLHDTAICQHTELPLLQTGYDDLIWFTAAGAGPFSSQPAIKTAEKGQFLLYASRKYGDCISPRAPVVITIKTAPRRQMPQTVLRCSDRPGDLKIGLKTAGDDRYEWSTGETDFQMLLPPADGRYTRAVTNMCGTSIDTFDVSSGACNDCLQFPNAFSPNGDGLNDGFRGRPRCVVSEFILRIYNRWGEMIFVAARPDDSWDGTQKGAPALLGTYMYQCSFTNVISGERIRVQGDLLLIR